MRPRNDRGTDVDPVPFVVVVAIGFLLCYVWGPIYGISYGFALRETLAICTVIFVAIVAGAYYRLVWTARPEMRGEVSAAVRFQRLVYATFLLIVLFTALSLPLVIR